MNYLAHLLLSDFREELLIGNILEDFLVGRIEHPRHDYLSAGIKQGVQLHRFIDSFTDSHPLVSQCKQLFYPTHGKYASVVVDVLFDYFLATNWQHFSKQPLHEFATWVYGVLPSYFSMEPAGFQRFIRALENYRWLESYAHDAGIEKALSNLDRRSTPPMSYVEAMPIFQANKPFLSACFNPFFSELQHASKSLIATFIYD